MTAIRSESARSWMQRNVLEIAFLGLGALFVLIAVLLGISA